MVTGAARADAALLVIDAQEGVRENSRRHGYLLSMLGIRQLVVLVNKMDLVGRNRQVFERIVGRVSRSSSPMSAYEPALHHSRQRRATATTSPHAPKACPGTRVRPCSRRSTGSRRRSRRSSSRSGCRCRTSTSSRRRATIGGSSPERSRRGRSASATRSSSIPSGKRSRVRTIEAFNRADGVRGDGRSGDRLHARGTDLRHARRDRRACRRAAAARQHAAARQPLLARPRPAGVG